MINKINNFLCSSRRKLRNNHMTSTPFLSVRTKVITSGNVSNLSNLKALFIFLKNSSVINDGELEQLSILNARFNRKYHLWLKSNGKVWTLNRSKAIYVFIKDLIVNSKANEPIRWVKSNKEGIPSFRGLRECLLFGKDNVVVLRLILTIFRQYDRIILPVDVKLDKIVDKSPISSDFNLNHFEDFAKEFTRIAFPEEIKMTESSLLCDWDARYKAGPNGSALLSSHLDAFAVFKNGKLFESLSKWFKDTGNSKFCDQLDQLIARYYLSKTSLVDIKDSVLRPLSERAGKTRLIAICDYWSQLALKPLRRFISVYCEQLAMDGTMNQEAQYERAVKLSTGNNVYCYDLSSATDSFPVELQRIVIKEIIGDNLSNLWVDIMGSRIFTMRSKHNVGENHLKGGFPSIEYGRGQPMGLYSSFAVFSLSHHYVVQYAYNLTCLGTGKDPNKVFSGYSIIGDDIVIWDKEVALQYKSVIDRLGVELQLTKSVVSEDPNHRKMEFCKRISTDGREVTPLSSDIINQSQTPLGFANLYIHLISRGWPLDTSNFIFPEAFSCKERSLLNLILHIWIGVPISETLYKRCFTKEELVDKMKDNFIESQLARLDKYNLSSTSKPDELTKKLLMEFCPETFKAKRCSLNIETLRPLYHIVSKDIEALESRSYLGLESLLQPSDVDYIPALNYRSLFSSKKKSPNKERAMAVWSAATSLGLFETGEKEK